MSTSPRGGALVAFRLADIPIEIRLRAKDRLLRASGATDYLPTTDSPIERVRIGIAAETPSDRLYWIRRERWERVMGR